MMLGPTDTKFVTDKLPQIKTREEVDDRRPAATRRGWYFYGVMGGVALLVVGAAWLWNWPAVEEHGPASNAGRSGSSNSPPDTVESGSDTSSVPRDSSAATGENSTPNDTDMWRSPVNGPPLDTRLVPLGTQVLLQVRVADLLSQSEGEKVLAALGPWGGWASQFIEERTGASLDEIDVFLVALHPLGDMWGSSFRLTLRQPITQAILNDRFPNSRTQDFGERSYRSQDGRALYLPSEYDGKVLVVCDTAVIEEMLSRASESVPLPRDLQRLITRTQSEQSVNIVLPARFFESSGRELLGSKDLPLLNAFRWLVPNEVTAVAISLDWRDHFFCEILASVVLNAAPHRVAAKFEGRLDDAPGEVQTLLDAFPVGMHGELVAARFPAMTRLLSTYTRTAEVDGLLLARCYLPLPAGHNLLMAAELLISGRGP